MFDIKLEFWFIKRGLSRHCRLKSVSCVWLSLSISSQISPYTDLSCLGFKLKIKIWLGCETRTRTPPHQYLPCCQKQDEALRSTAQKNSIKPTFRRPDFSKNLISNNFVCQGNINKQLSFSQQLLLTFLFLDFTFSKPQKIPIEHMVKMRTIWVLWSYILRIIFIFVAKGRTVLTR